MTVAMVEEFGAPGGIPDPGAARNGRRKAIEAAFRRALPALMRRESFARNYPAVRPAFRVLKKRKYTLSRNRMKHDIE